MDTNSRIFLESLLNKFFADKCTAAEKGQLYNLISDSANESLFKELIYKQLYYLHDVQIPVDNSIDKDRIYGNILNEIKQSGFIESEMNLVTRKIKFRKILIFGMSMAAVFFVAFFLGNIISFSGKRISSASSITYTYSEIKAPFGSKSEIKLPDGTLVLLNAGSSLRYRNDFNINNRDLSLVGEAYFTVAKNADVPFNVSTGSISIKAVGTEFNVKAYEDEDVIETTLIEGKIEIKQSGKNINDTLSVNLIPNQKAIYVKETDSFTLEKIKSADSMTVSPVKSIYQNIYIAPKVDVTQVVAWTQGKLIIRGESLDNICVELQRKYDVSFVFKNEEIKKYRLSGVLLDETLEQVLSVIKLTAPIDFYLEGKSVYLSSDKEQLGNYLQHLK